jgi:hypothetical protein
MNIDNLFEGKLPDIFPDDLKLFYARLWCLFG